MQATGRVQESFNNGVTSVTLPPNPAAYTNASAGDVFVQFDVLQSAIGASERVLESAARKAAICLSCVEARVGIGTA